MSFKQTGDGIDDIQHVPTTQNMQVYYELYYMLCIEYYTLYYTY